MSNLLFGHDKTVADWVGSKIRKEFTYPFTAIGVVNAEGRLTGGFVFNNHNGDSIEMSLAGSGVAARGIWIAVIDYVFKQLGCVRLQIHTRYSNKEVKKQAPRLGFTFEGVARSFYRKEDALVYSIVKNDLPKFTKRWKIKNG